MKRIQLKAFTLVEMLIVIVIIGILIAALLPRLSGAQSMARDTARKTALSQIGAGIIAYQAQYGQRPLKASATGTDHLTDLVSKGLMTEVPKDRLQDNIVSGLWNATTTGDFLYLVLDKNSVPFGGFVLMAHTETPGNSNRVVDDTANKWTIWVGKQIEDLKNVLPCTSVELSGATQLNTGSVCYAASLNNLRYIYMY